MLKLNKDKNDLNVLSLYRILFHACKLLIGTVKLYLNDLIQNYIPVKRLWSESCSRLTVPTSHTRSYGNKSLGASAPMMWNKLANQIKLSPNK